MILLDFISSGKVGEIDSLSDFRSGEGWIEKLAPVLSVFLMG